MGMANESLKLTFSNKSIVSKHENLSHDDFT